MEEISLGIITTTNVIEMNNILDNYWFVLDIFEVVFKKFENNFIWNLNFK
jgi:hypothetical protein